MRPLRILVIDDSAFVRKIVREILNRSVGIEVVGTARDGEEGLELVTECNPDVVTCDLTMPRLDGLGFVRQQMARRPLPILILTAAPESGGAIIEALSAGAIDFVRKPTALATEELLAIADELIAKIRSAITAPLENLVRPDAPPLHPVLAALSPQATRTDLVVIGVSTGGPQALRRMLPLFAANFPVPIAIVLHMPIGYTAMFAEKLNEICAIEVHEAKQGELLRPGVVVLAEAGRHLKLRRTAEGVAAELSLQPVTTLHRPSANVLFQSAAEIYGGRVLAAVMTGMGDDGKDGAALVKAAGGVVLTEAEQSCIIYGMPRSVVEAGLSDAAVPLDDMAAAIFSRL